MAGLAPGLANIGGGLPQAGKPPKPPGLGRAGRALLGGLPQPGVRTAGSALLNAANSLTGPTKPQAAGAPANPPASVTAPPSGSPLDSTYYQNVAQNQYKVNSQINALNLQQSQDQTALQSALAQLAYQQPRDQLALEQRANAGGGLYSSVENMNQGNLVHSYATRQTADQSNFSNMVAKIAAQIAALQGGEQLFENSEALAAGQRAAAAAQNNPALTAPAAAAVPAPAGGGGAGGGGKGVGSAGGALLGAMGALTGGRAGVASAGGALSNRAKLMNALAGRRR